MRCRDARENEARGLADDTAQRLRIESARQFDVGKGAYLDDPAAEQEPEDSAAEAAASQREGFARLEVDLLLLVA